MKLKNMMLIFMICFLIFISISCISATDNVTISNFDGSNYVLADDSVDGGMVVVDDSVDGGMVVVDDSVDGGMVVVDDDIDDGSSVDVDDSGSSDAASIDTDDGDSIINNMANDIPKYNKEPISNVEDGGNSFGDVQKLINDLPAGSVLYLYKDYAMQNGESPISLSNISINGNGYTLNANYRNSIFEINGGNIVLSNLALINGKSTHGAGAIHLKSASQLRCENIRFINNFGKRWAGAVCIDSQITSTFINCIFEDNHADDNGGAVYAKGDLYVYSSNFDNNYAACQGGALYACKECTVKDSSFNNNYAKDQGGAIYSSDLLNIYSSKFHNNTALDHGGALYSKLYIFLYGDNEFIGNEAKNSGGAIYVGRDVYVNCISFGRTIFNSNRANSDNGGAIYSEANVYMERSNFTSNYANDDGGAVYAKGYVSVDSCNFNNNYAAHQGGAIYNKEGFSLLGRNYFIGNEAKDSGGALYVARFAENVTHAIFENNKAGVDGGAVYINRGNTVTFSVCSFENNQAGDEGGAIYMDDKDSHLSLYHNNFVNNTAKSGYTVYNCGKYDKLEENWHGSASPNFDNQFKEWRFILKDKVHIPTSYLISRYNV